MNNISYIENSTEFLQEIQKDALSKRIFVFTPS
jgi:(p)ppGpp synthase/HD superfamily hydrolase